jgi:hypothetical protein
MATVVTTGTAARVLSVKTQISRLVLSSIPKLRLVSRETNEADRAMFRGALFFSFGPFSALDQFVNELSSTLNGSHSIISGADLIVLGLASD